MAIVSKLVFAALTGLFIANFASPASAQDAARDAAIHKCITEAAVRAIPDVSKSRATSATARISTGRAWRRRAKLREPDSLTRRARELASWTEM